MAKLQPHSVNKILTGKRGDKGSRKNGKVRTKKKSSDRELSPLQKIHQNRWEDSKAYGRIATSDPELNSWYAKFAKNKKFKGAWHFAIRDYYNLPVIGQITKGKPDAGAKFRLRIKALDLFKVQRVMVCLKAPDGTTHEKGQAFYNTLDLLWDFDFMTDLGQSTDMKLTVMVVDLPGNIVYRDLIHPYFDTEPASVPESSTSKKKEYVKSRLRPRPL